MAQSFRRLGQTGAMGEGEYESVGWLVLLAPNDGKIRVASTRLEGAKYHLILPATPLGRAQYSCDPCRTRLPPPRQLHTLGAVEIAPSLDADRKFKLVALHRVYDSLAGWG